MSNFEDLRATLDEDEFENASELPSQSILLNDDQPRRSTNGKFLGMTAGERAFLSVMLFLNVLLLGAGVLIATGRINF